MTRFNITLFREDTNRFGVRCIATATHLSKNTITNIRQQHTQPDRHTLELVAKYLTQRLGYPISAERWYDSTSETRTAAPPSAASPILTSSIEDRLQSEVEAIKLVMESLSRKEPVRAMLSLPPFFARNLALQKDRLKQVHGNHPGVHHIAQAIEQRYEQISELNDRSALKCLVCSDAHQHYFVSRIRGSIRSDLAPKDAYQSVTDYKDFVSRNKKLTLALSHGSPIEGTWYIGVDRAIRIGHEPVNKSSLSTPRVQVFRDLALVDQLKQSFDNAFATTRVNTTEFNDFLDGILRNASAHDTQNNGLLKIPKKAIQK